MPKSSRIRNGPNIRLSTSRGWRRISLISLLKKESSRMITLGIIAFFTSCLRHFSAQLYSWVEQGRLGGGRHPPPNLPPTVKQIHPFLKHALEIYLICIG